MATKISDDMVFTDELIPTMEGLDELFSTTTSLLMSPSGYAKNADDQFYDFYDLEKINEKNELEFFDSISSSMNTSNTNWNELQMENHDLLAEVNDMTTDLIIDSSDSEVSTNVNNYPQSPCDSHCSSVMTDVSTAMSSGMEEEFDVHEITGEYDLTGIHEEEKDTKEFDFNSPSKRQKDEKEYDLTGHCEIHNFITGVERPTKKSKKEALDTELQLENDLLQKEYKYLEAQYDFLVSRVQRDKNITSKRRQRKQLNRTRILNKQHENEVLRDVIVKQRQFLDNLNAMLAGAPVNDPRNALMTPMETYIHLGYDLRERREILMNMRDEKIDMAFKFIESKTAGIDVNKPFQHTDIFQKFGKCYGVSFVISKYDNIKVADICKVIYHQVIGQFDEAQSKPVSADGKTDAQRINEAMSCLTIREKYDQMQCKFTHQKLIFSACGNTPDDDKMEIETNCVFFNRFSDNAAIMVTDYIDRDDLHPYETARRIRKDVSSAVVLTEQVDEKTGQVSVIMKRYLLAKFHTYQHNVADKVIEGIFKRFPKCQLRDQKKMEEHAGITPSIPSF